MTQHPTQTGILLIIGYGKIKNQVNPKTLETRMLLAKQALTKASKQAQTKLLVICDEVSKPLTEGLNLETLDYPNETYDKVKQIGIQKLLNLSRDLTHIFLCEPEKVDMIYQIPHMLTKLSEKKADVCIAERKSVKSYPEWQQYWEKCGNIMVERFIHLKADYLFGPRLYSRKAAEALSNLTANTNTLGNHHLLWTGLLELQNQGFKLSTHKLDFTYPPKQTKAEDHDTHIILRRCEILKSIIYELHLYSEQNKKQL